MPRPLSKKRLAGDELQNQKLRAIDFVETVDRRDVRMIQGSQQLGFAFEPGQPVCVPGERIGEGLDRDLAPEARVSRLPDLAHSAFAKFRADFIEDNPCARLHQWGRV